MLQQLHNSDFNPSKSFISNSPCLHWFLTASWDKYVAYPNFPQFSQYIFLLPGSLKINWPVTTSVARNTTSCFLFPLHTHLTTFSKLYFKNHQERNAFMYTCGKCWKGHYVLFSTSVDVHKNKACHEMRVLMYNISTLFPPGQGVWLDAISFSSLL